MTVNQAVAALRQHVHQSQQIFATRMALSISALQKHEQTTQPDPKQLLIYQREAERVGRDDLARIFRNALTGSFNSPVGFVHSLFTTVDLFESTAVWALLNVLRPTTEAIRYELPTQDSVQRLVETIAELLRQIKHVDYEAFVAEGVRRGLLKKSSVTKEKKRK
jgi:hypothetical protein